MNPSLSSTRRLAVPTAAGGRALHALAEAARVSLGLFYLGSAVFNAIHTYRDRSVFPFWADHAMTAFHRWLMTQLVLPHQGAVVVATVLFELIVGCLMLSWGRAVRVGMLAAALFNLGLAPLWSGQLPVSLTLAAIHLALVVPLFERGFFDWLAAWRQRGGRLAIVLDEIAGAVSIGIAMIFSALLRPWYRRWGATAEETRMTLPGDELVQPWLETTRAITIAAPPGAVWPWLLQLGQGRGGLYSYTGLENLVGCQMVNVERILPELQRLAVGDQIALAPGEGSPSFQVAAIQPERALVLRTFDSRKGEAGPMTWVFAVLPGPEGTTRLLARSRGAFPRTFGNIIMWRVMVDPVFFVMERRMLIGIRDCVERPRRDAR